MNDDVKTLIGMLHVKILIDILRKTVGESDVMMLAALINEEAELKEGKTDLPTVRQLAHELICIAQKALTVLEAKPHVADESIAKKGEEK